MSKNVNNDVNMNPPISRGLNLVVSVVFLTFRKNKRIETFDVWNNLTTFVDFRV